MDGGGQGEPGESPEESYLNDLRSEISAIRGQAERTRTLLTGGEETSAGHDSDFQNFEGSGQCEQINLVYTSKRRTSESDKNGSRTPECQAAGL